MIINALYKLNHIGKVGNLTFEKKQCRLLENSLLYNKKSCKE
jgi:hypothetical protein